MKNEITTKKFVVTTAISVFVLIIICISLNVRTNSIRLGEVIDSINEADSLLQAECIDATAEHSTVNINRVNLNYIMTAYDHAIPVLSKHEEWKGYVVERCDRFKRLSDSLERYDNYTKQIAELLAAERFATAELIKDMQIELGRNINQMLLTLCED